MSANAAGFDVLKSSEDSSWTSRVFGWIKRIGAGISVWNTDFRNSVPLAKVSQFDDWASIRFAWDVKLQLLAVAALAAGVGVWNEYLAPSGQFVFAESHQYVLQMLTFSLAVLLAVKTTQSYNRWWEGRIILGKIIEVARCFLQQTLLWLPPTHRSHLGPMAVRWTIASMYVMKGHISEAGPKIADLLDSLLPHEAAYLATWKNRPLGISHVWTWILQESEMDAQRQAHIQDLVVEYERRVSGCERILRTSMPVDLQRVTTRYVMLYLFLAPIMLWPATGWGTVALAPFLAFLLLGMENVGTQIEQCFNTMPLEAMCATIKRDCWEMEGRYMETVKEALMGQGQYLLLKQQQQHVVDLQEQQSKLSTLSTLGRQSILLGTQAQRASVDLKSDKLLYLGKQSAQEQHELQKQKLGMQDQKQKQSRYDKDQDNSKVSLLSWQSSSLTEDPEELSSSGKSGSSRSGGSSGASGSSSRASGSSSGSRSSDEVPSKPTAVPPPSEPQFFPRTKQGRVFKQDSACFYRDSAGATRSAAASKVTYSDMTQDPLGVKGTSFPAAIEMSQFVSGSSPPANFGPSLQKSGSSFAGNAKPNLKSSLSTSSSMSDFSRQRSLHSLPETSEITVQEPHSSYCEETGSFSQQKLGSLSPISTDISQKFSAGSPTVNIQNILQDSGSKTPPPSEPSPSRRKPPSRASSFYAPNLDPLESRKIGSSSPLTSLSPEQKLSSLYTLEKQSGGKLPSTIPTFQRQDSPLISLGSTTPPLQQPHALKKTTISDPHVVTVQTVTDSKYPAPTFKDQQAFSPHSSTAQLHPPTSYPSTHRTTLPVSHTPTSQPPLQLSSNYTAHTPLPSSETSFRAATAYQPAWDSPYSSSAQTPQLLSTSHLPSGGTYPAATQLPPRNATIQNWQQGAGNPFAALAQQSPFSPGSFSSLAQYSYPSSESSYPPTPQYQQQPMGNPFEASRPPLGPPSPVRTAPPTQQLLNSQTDELALELAACKQKFEARKAELAGKRLHGRPSHRVPMRAQAPMPPQILTPAQTLTPVPRPQQGLNAHTAPLVNSQHTFSQYALPNPTPQVWRSDSPPIIQLPQHQQFLQTLGGSFLPPVPMSQQGFGSNHPEHIHQQGFGSTHSEIVEHAFPDQQLDMLLGSSLSPLLQYTHRGASQWRTQMLEQDESRASHPLMHQADFRLFAEQQNPHMSINMPSSRTSSDSSVDPYN